MAPLMTELHGVAPSILAADDLGSSEWSVWQHGSRPMYLQTLPHRDATDGFFVARLRRGEAS